MHSTMWPTATDVTSHISVSVSVTLTYCAKTAEPIEMLFGADSRGPRDHVLDWSQDLTNPFAATRGDKLAMRPFAKLL